MWVGPLVDWKILHDNLDDMFKAQRDAPEKFTAYCTDKPEWIVIVSPNIQTNGTFHSGYQSYTFVMSAAYHKNEHENLFSKLNDACSNLATHAASEDEKTKISS